MKFLVPNYSCLQNPWLGGYRPQVPVLSVLNWICWNPPPPNKFLGTPLAPRVAGRRVCRMGRQGLLKCSVLSGNQSLPFLHDRITPYTFTWKPRRPKLTNSLQRTTRCHIPQYSNLHQLHREKLKSHITQRAYLTTADLHLCLLSHH